MNLKKLQLEYLVSLKNIDLFEYKYESYSIRNELKENKNNNIFEKGWMIVSYVDNEIEDVIFNSSKEYILNLWDKFKKRRFKLRRIN